MKAQLQKKISDLDILFEQTVLSKKNIEKKDKNSSYIEDKQILFLLQNNLLSQIGKLETLGYELQPEHQRQYNTQLYQAVLSNPDDTIREYLKQGIEMPDEYVAFCFLLQMQEEKDTTPAPLRIHKIISSFFDKVKKGLQNDPVAQYKFVKIKDPVFINNLFEVWYLSSKKHLEDIENNVVNEQKFWFFTYNKNKSRMKKDLSVFSEQYLQKHIVLARKFFKIPLENEFFFEHIDMTKIEKLKELYDKNEQIIEKFNRYTYYQSTLDGYCNDAKILHSQHIIEFKELLQSKIKQHYQNNPDKIIKHVQLTNSEQYIKKSVTRDLIKGVDDKLLNDLPMQGLQLMQEIKQVSKTLYEKDINVETKDMIEFLYKEKLPEVINKYLNIDKAYRHNLKNVQGKTAQDLMLESLEIIKQSLSLIEKDINEENLKDLSIHTRYLKKVLKS